MASNSNAINLGATGAVPKERISAVKSSTDANQCFEPPDIDPVTLKRNPKMELSKEDLLKLLSCLEGELQARDVVIATLKNEKVKQMLVHARYGKLNFADPLMALQRDGCCVKEQTLDEVAVRSMTDNQMSSLENLIRAQRTSQLKMVQYLQDADARHARVVQELQEEKSKHEHDTAQGDDVTYALERERTRLREELDNERAARQKVELELKKCAETLEEQQTRQKGMVLLLLAERKKIVAKYVDERKRSEDLAQIMSEEKGRVASMAEGLEEESKKSLLLEAELERHVSTFSTEKIHLKSALSKEEKRYQELLCEHDKLQRECDRLRNQLSEAHQVAMFQANSMSQRLAASGSSTTSRSAGQSTLPHSLANKPSSSSRSGGAGSSATLNPSKTGISGGGIRRSTSPGVAMGVTASPSVAASSSASVGTAAVDDPHQKTPHQTAAKALPSGGGPPPAPAAHRTADGTTGMSSSTQMGGMTFGASPNTRNMAAYSGSSQPTGLPSSLPQQQVVRVAPRVSVASASPGTKVVSSSQPGRVLFHVTSPAVGGSTSSSTAGVTPRRPPLGRGVPPPVPPNKPAVPPLSSRPPPVPPTAPCGVGTSAPAPHGGSRPSPQVPPS